MEFACLNENCLQTHHFNDPEPETWDRSRRYAREGRYRHKCPWCGAAMTAVSYYPPRDGKRWIVPGDYRAFSDCPNAQYCSEEGLYRPDCETAGLKKDCLERIYSLLVELDLRLQHIETLAEDPRSDRATPRPDQKRGKFPELHTNAPQKKPSPPD
jgi:hypothetical protein